MCGSWPREHRRGSTVSLALSPLLQTTPLPTTTSWLWAPHLGGRGCAGMPFTHHMEPSSMCKPAELNADSAGAVKPHFARHLRRFGTFLHLARGQPALEETPRNSSMHQLPSSYLIKERASSKFTFPGYTWGTLQAVIAPAEMWLHRSIWTESGSSLWHWPRCFSSSGWKEKAAQWTVFFLY